MPATTNERVQSGPRLERLLADVRARMRRQIWLHGLGTAAAGAGAWLALAYLADRWLHLPAPIRVFHGVVLVALPLFLARRTLWRHLARVPGVEGIALFVERRVPRSGERLVSAIQLAPLAAHPETGPLVRRVQREAEELAGAVHVDALFDGRPPRRRFFAGAAIAAAAAVLLAVQPAMAGIFFQRMLGRSVEWPRRTTLFVEIPSTSALVRVEESEGEIVVRLARGTDLEVQVRAEGTVPDFVTVHFASGLREQVPSGGRTTFRTLLRGVQADAEFHITGGDDRRGEPRVRLLVLEPPDVAGVAFTIEPPPYTGLPREVRPGPEVEVLAGSRVTVHVRADPVGARGVARTFPDALEIPLAPVPWPLGDAPPNGASDGAPAAAYGELGFELTADASTRFRFELVDETGLANPEPGLFGIQVAVDRRPELTLIAPGQATVEIVPGGAVPLRLWTRDDFGIAGAEYTVRDGRNEGDPIATGPLPLRPAPGAAVNERGEPRAALAKLRIEVDALRGEAEPGFGEAFTLSAVVRDGREPTPNESVITPVLLRVVSADDLLRSIREGLSGVGEEAEKLVGTVETLGRRLLDTEAALAGEDAANETGALIGLAADARHAEGDAARIARDLAALAERLLYSRIDTRALPLLERLDTLLDAGEDRAFQTAAWRQLSDEYGSGALGKADLGGDLVALVGLALEVASPHAEGVAAALQAARESDGPASAREAVQAARVKQVALLDAAERLFVRLGEWDDFQSVLGLTKDLLSRQKNLQRRTEELSKE